MYKDKDKQKQANRKAQARFKAKAKGITGEGITEQGITGGLPPDDVLFAAVPEPCRIYANGELGGDWYKQLIHKLKTSTIDQLRTEGVFIPCWRYTAGHQCP